MNKVTRSLRLYLYNFITALRRCLGGDWKSFLHKGKLPDFIIIGVQKGGSRAIKDNLVKHPLVMIPDVWEVHFFDDDRYWNRGIGWYKKLFSGRVCGEKTPQYIFFPKAIKRMHEVVPNAKLILSLRNPADRAFSQYQMMISPSHQERRKKRGLPIELPSFSQLINQLMSVFPYSCKVYFSNHLGFDDFNAYTEISLLLQHGIYIYQIKNLLKYFSRSQLYIVIQERMRKYTPAEINKIIDFLGLPPLTGGFKTPDEFIAQYPYHYTKQAVKMSPEDRKILNEFYRPYNEMLFEFLGQRIPEWDG
ncbi:MAG: sulfotransferase domain-containing protein [Deltaproteobacteria bacterium]|nr:sulfotransferase domain-containing protein [Deltaproteobacteria bacterium]